MSLLQARNIHTALQDLVGQDIEDVRAEYAARLTTLVLPLFPTATLQAMFQTFVLLGGPSPTVHNGVIAVAIGLNSDLTALGPPA